MALLELVFALGGMTFFVLPVLYLRDTDRDGVKDPAVEEVRKRKERRDREN